MARFAVLLVAAGKSSRFQGKEKKPFADLDGSPVWLRTAQLFTSRDDVGKLILLIAAEDAEMFSWRYGANASFLGIEVLHGGAERHDSVAHGLAAVPADCDLVAVHDAVRPCVTSEQIAAVFAAACRHGGAILAQPIVETVKRADGQGTIIETVPRSGLWLAQTPQVFRKDWLADAYARRAQLGQTITDDAQLVEAAGYAVHVVEGSAQNVKITTASDLTLAAAILRSRPKPSTRPHHPFADEQLWR